MLPPGQVAIATGSMDLHAGALGRHFPGARRLCAPGRGSLPSRPAVCGGHARASGRRMGCRWSGPSFRKAAIKLVPSAISSGIWSMAGPGGRPRCCFARPQRGDPNKTAARNGRVADQRVAGGGVPAAPLARPRTTLLRGRSGHHAALRPGRMEDGNTNVCLRRARVWSSPDQALALGGPSFLLAPNAADRSPALGAGFGSISPCRRSKRLESTVFGICGDSGVGLGLRRIRRGLDGRRPRDAL